MSADEQISWHIFVPNGGYCLYNVISADKNVYEELNGWMRSCGKIGLIDV